MSAKIEHNGLGVVAAFSVLLASVVHAPAVAAQPVEDEPAAAEEQPAVDEAPTEASDLPPTVEDDPAAEPAPEMQATGAAKADRGASGDASAAADGAADGAAAKAGDAGEAGDAADGEAEPEPTGRFAFGTYGRVVAASDATGRPIRNADIVAFGSRLDELTYVELELRREDRWSFGATTRVVATLALQHPAFHYDGEFDAQLAPRNMYIEERGLGLEGLSVWAGSRMLRGDDIYLLNHWFLDNLNTFGGGVQYDAPTHTSVRAHVGVGQPNNPFYRQEAERAVPLNQFGSATVDILDRQRVVGSLKAEQQIRFGKAGVKLVGYGEAHHTPSGQRETLQPRVFEEVPSDGGFVAGLQFGAFSGERDTHVNIFLRYANGLPAYPDFARPSGLALDRSTEGAHELLAAVGGNYEVGPVAIMATAYVRSFRNANDALDFGDVDEGLVMMRPSVFFVDWAGLAVEGSFQALQRGVLTDLEQPAGAVASAEPSPLTARVGRVGVLPFLTPRGRGSFSRPMIHLTYLATFRDAGARALYPVDDVYGIREIDHFFGVGAEWWFGSTSYGGLTW